MRWSVRVVACLAVAACAREPSREPAHASTSGGSGSTASPRTAARATTSQAAIPFIEDDGARALADARARHVPLFVDAWAPWCHSCMSMRAFVFTDPRVVARRADFAWLSLDTEKPENAAFLARFPIDVLPTLFVIDPARETSLVKWPGSLTAPELVDMLDDATKSPSPGAADAMTALLLGDRAAAQGDARAAIDRYRAALAVAPANWSRRGRLVDSLVSRLADAKALGECAKIAAAEGARLPPTTARADVAIAGATCAIDAEDHPAENAVARQATPTLLSELRTLTSNLELPLLADDRSGAFEALVDLDKAQHDASAAKEAGRGWATFLEGEAAKAADPAARAVFDPHRLLAYVEIGAPERAIPMLEQTAKDLPGDYNPHARLARAYLEMKRYEDAVAEADRAIALAYGPRKLRIYVQKADILKAKGDAAAEKAALRDALAYAATVPLREGYVKLKEQIEARARR